MTTPFENGRQRALATILNGGAKRKVFTHPASGFTIWAFEYTGPRTGRTDTLYEVHNATGSLSSGPWRSQAEAERQMLKSITSDLYFKAHQK